MSVKVGSRVQVVGKDIVGTVAYVGATLFSSGKWIGVVLDEAKGKNNGEVQGKRYFECPDNYGIFVRQSQIMVIEGQSPQPHGGKSVEATAETPRVKRETTEDKLKKRSGLRPPGGRGISDNLDSERVEPSVKPTGLKLPSAARPISRLKAPMYSRSTENIAATPARGSPALEGKTPASRSGLPRKAPSTQDLSSKRSQSNQDLSNKTPSSQDVSKMSASMIETTTARPPSQDVTAVSDIASKRSPSAQDLVASAVSGAEAKRVSMEQQQIIDGLMTEKKDLEEKLDTLKVKRQEDKTKLKEFEKVKIQLQQLQEYKTRTQESLKDLQQQLMAAKNEVKATQEQFDQYKDEMSEVSETVELATLDKEMAEEKSETLQLEVETLKEKNEELSMDLELLRAEISEAGTDGAATSYQVKQLEQQSERLKEALVKLRDMANAEKQENQSLKKQMEKKNTENNQLNNSKERAVAENTDLQTQIIDLKEQVDAALGAEEMVETLTEKNLELEERLQELEEEKTDLEALYDMNEELQENTREQELELREDVDMANSRAHEAEKKLEAMQVTISDYQTTITKFRELVTQLQETNRDLRSQAETETVKVETPSIEFDFKAKFAETKAHAKAIDMDLRQLEAQQANEHVDMMCLFMPDFFLRRGSDHDALRVLLFIPRLIQKSSLLSAQVKTKFECPDHLEKEQVLASSQADQFSFGTALVHLLTLLQTILAKYQSALNSCAPELYMKIGTLLPELSHQEKSIDHLIDLLRKDQLDETVSLESLIKSIHYFQHLYSVHLASESADCTLLMADYMKLILAACDCIHMDVSRLKLIMQPGQETSDISILFKDLDAYNQDTKLAARKIKRHLPQTDGSGVQVKFSDDVQEVLKECSENITNLVMTMQEMGKGSSSEAALIGNHQGLQAKKLEQLAYQAVDKVFTKDESGPFDCLRNTFIPVVNGLNKMATSMENGDYDVHQPQQAKKPDPPLHVRAKEVKGQISDIENLRFKLEAKDGDITELKKLLKAKQEELSQQQIRVGLVEKKLETAGKEGDERGSKIQRKLDEANSLLKKKEKEFDETMDALQQDIDALEREKVELKERLRILSKKTLLEGLSRQSGVAALVAGSSSSPVTTPTSPSSSAGFPSVVRDSPLLLQQVDSLKMALKHLKNENTRLNGEKMKAQMSLLRPLNVPKKPVGLTSGAGLVKLGEVTENVSGWEKLNHLSRQSNGLLKDLYQMMSCPKVVDISKRRPGSEPIIDKACPASQLVEEATRLTRLQRQASQLQVDVTNMLATSRNGGQVRSDFSIFPTPSYAKVLHEKTGASECIGRITVPVASGQGETIPVDVQPDQLRKIHLRFSS